MRGPRVGRGIVWGLLFVALVLSGCVKRTILIQSDPPGATVLINGHEAGVTPLDYPFIIHGRYRFTVSKPGFEEVSALEWVKAPWHQWIPIDVVTELLLPIRFDDVHQFSYRLQPATPSERVAAEPPVSLEALQAQLRAPDPARRREACVVMARRHLTGGVTALEAATHDPAPDVRAAALQAVRVLVGREVLPELARALALDPSPAVRWRAAAELEALRTPESRPALQQALSDPDPFVRATVVEALGTLGDRAAAPAVAARIADQDIVVRRSAATAAGRLADPVAAPALVKALRDPDDRVRRQAAHSLRLLKVPSTSVALARALRDPDPQVRATVVGALREFGTPAAVPITLRFIRSWSAATRASAAEALEALKDPRAVPVLQGAVGREPNLVTRLAMAHALVELGAWRKETLAPFEAAVKVEEREAAHHEHGAGGYAIPRRSY